MKPRPPNAAKEPDLPAESQSQDLQALCARGQELLLATDYLAAEAMLLRAEALALGAGDFDTLARLYLPLQEARRQRRQRCGEGVICLDLIAKGPDDRAIDAQAIARLIPCGQLLVAGWGSIAPALALREIAWREKLYLETFLAAAYEVGDKTVIVIAPHARTKLPTAQEKIGSVEELRNWVGYECLIFPLASLPKGERRGAKAYSQVMLLWERLHGSFLTEVEAMTKAWGEAMTDPMWKMDAYRQVIEVDYACELAHQRLSETAMRLARERASQRESR
jgi:hypothetical protein